ncbi:hypothetical protein [Streptomyces sp. MUM 178J]|uniref:hypothetical protein n=1 Tax=Streptomyces sp. MUM 178J TaxID=2791991 RepID=UPI001F04D4C6|nr:hypothetical protein [Streptomyces sp. MUM 178J]WRQ81408.1 hypothetical protein I3F59_019810 [Streptomyces sp. MUM 178J]
MNNRKFLVTATLCVTAAMGLAACGGNKDGEDKKADAAASPSPKATEKPDPLAGLTADQIADKALDTTKAVNSLKVKGSKNADGELTEFDVAVTQKGDCAGTLRSGGSTADSGSSADIRVVGKAAYVKGDEKYYQETGEEDGASAEEGAGIAELLKGRWIKVPEDEGDPDDLAAICDVDIHLELADRSKTGLAKGEDADVDGKKAAVLTKKSGAETFTYYVSKDGEPYLLKFTSEGGKEPESVQFADFNASLTVEAPPADQVLDPAKLGG